MIYPPSDDSYLLEKEVRKIAKGKNVLDIGTGSGIQAQAALESGAKKVLASDINPESVKHCQKKGLNAKKSDLFENIKGKFDLITFNPPYLPEDKCEDSESAKTTTGGKKGDELTIKFLKNAKNHLTKNGKILLVVSSITPKKKIEFLIKENKMKKIILTSQKFFMETLEVWKISFSN